MTFEEIKRKLSEYKGLKKLLSSERERISALKDRLYDVKVTDYEKIRVKSSVQSTYKENLIDRISKIESRADEVQTQLFAIEDMIADNMGNLSPIEQAMVIDRYMNGWSWERICKKYHYEERQPHNILNSAIQKMARN